MISKSPWVVVVTCVWKYVLAALCMKPFLFLSLIGQIGKDSRVPDEKIPRCGSDQASVPKAARRHPADVTGLFARQLRDHGIHRALLIAQLTQHGIDLGKFRAQPGCVIGDARLFEHDLVIDHIDDVVVVVLDDVEGAIVFIGEFVQDIDHLTTFSLPQGSRAGDGGIGGGIDAFDGETLGVRSVGGGQRGGAVAGNGDRRGLAVDGGGDDLAGRIRRVGDIKGPVTGKAVHVGADRKGRGTGAAQIVGGKERGHAVRVGGQF